MCEEASEFIPTKGSAAKRKAPNDFQVITYESYKSKKKLKEKVEDSGGPQENVSSELNVKRAKHDIFKFAMSGFDAQKKEEAKVQLAIKLGAKPPKNKFKNYKQLLEDKKKEKEEKKSQLQLLGIGKNTMGKSTAKGKTFDKKRKKSKGGILGIYGTVKAADLKQRGKKRS